MKFLENISLKDYNTFGIDVKARRMVVVEPRDFMGFAPAAVGGQWLDPQGRNLVLGAGSDVVFTRDFDGTVVLLANFHYSFAYQEQQQISAWGGMTLDSLVRWAVGNGFYGLENLSAIPGTVGAAVVQNVGAYGVEAKDVVGRVVAYDMEQRRICRFSNAECQFAYRDSVFKHHPGRYLVLRVFFRYAPTFTPNLAYKALEGMPHSTAQEMRDSVTALRWQKLPRPSEHGSAGSFFKNPVVDEATYLRLKGDFSDMPEAHPTAEGYKLSAGWLIDRAGWKGRTMGRVGVWPQNALVLYNTGGCTGAEVVALADAIQADIKSKFGIALTLEAIII